MADMAKEIVQKNGYSNGNLNSYMLDACTYNS